jgi:predicted transcriptional regulator
MRSIAGWFLVVFGLIGYGAEIDNLRKGTTDNSAMGFVLATLSLLGGAALIRAARRAKLPPELRERLAVEQLPARSPRDIEKAVLACAKQHGGRVTIAEVATESDLSFTEAKEVLEELSRAGACTVDVTEEGAFIYEFLGLLPREAKREALDV